MNQNTSNLKNNNKERLFQLYTRTYGKLSAPIMNKNSFYKMLEYYPKMIMFRNNSGIRSAMLYWPGPRGKKLGLSFGNSNYQKNVVVPFSAQLLKKNNNHWYAELSHGAEHILTRNHSLKPIVNKRTITSILPNAQNIQNNGQYTRKISTLGSLKKRLYGNPIVSPKSKL